MFAPRFRFANSICMWTVKKINAMSTHLSSPFLHPHLMSKLEGEIVWHRQGAQRIRCLHGCSTGFNARRNELSSQGRFVPLGDNQSLGSYGNVRPSFKWHLRDWSIHLFPSLRNTKRYKRVSTENFSEAPLLGGRFALLVLSSFYVFGIAQPSMSTPTTQGALLTIA